MTLKAIFYEEQSVSGGQDIAKFHMRKDDGLSQVVEIPVGSRKGAGDLQKHFRTRALST